MMVDGDFVASKADGPIVFGDQKKAAIWILRTGQSQSYDQIFEIANHPTVKNSFTAHETGRNPGDNVADDPKPDEPAAEDEAKAPEPEPEDHDKIELKPEPAENKGVAGETQTPYIPASRMEPVGTLVPTKRQQARPSMPSAWRRWDLAARSWQNTIRQNWWTRPPSGFSILIEGETS
jgi:hypothetical protein